MSPVIAVLSTGLVIGNYGRQKGMSPPTQLAVNSFWEYAAFVVNSLVFLLIGLEIHVTRVWEKTFRPLCWAIVATLVARLARYLSPNPDFQPVQREAFRPMANRAVLGWSARVAFHCVSAQPPGCGARTGATCHHDLWQRHL